MNQLPQICLPGLYAIVKVQSFKNQRVGFEPTLGNSFSLSFQRQVSET
jgi:hypothetical protein